MVKAKHQVAHRLRARIVRGDWPPGSRLPDRSRLARELGTSLATVQEAVVQVATEGFLRVGARKHGTFVADHPPHLARYRVVFPFDPGNNGLFWQSLAAAAEDQDNADYALSCFYGLSGHRDISDYQEVIDEVRTGRIAGLIFASSADELAGTPFLDQPGVPRVAVAVPGQLPGVPKVCPDYGSFFTQAVDHLIAAGRQDIAVVFPDHTADAAITGMHRDCRQALAAHGLDLPQAWQQFASLTRPLGAAHLLALMFDPGQAHRPDGLILADDNFLTAATAGIAATGIRVPEQLTIVSMANFPCRAPAHVPVTRLGFDVPALLGRMIDLIQAVRADATPPENTPIPAVFDPAPGITRDRGQRKVRP